MKLKFIFIIIALVAFGHNAPSYTMKNSIPNKNLSQVNILLSIAINRSDFIIVKHAIESGAQITLNDKINAETKTELLLKYLDLAYQLDCISENDKKIDFINSQENEDLKNFLQKRYRTIAKI